MAEKKKPAAKEKTEASDEVSVDAADSTYKPGPAPDEDIVPAPGPSTVQELGKP